MNKHIQKIVNDPFPECRVLGHRVHVTMNYMNERWPPWGVLVFGIAGGFIHFECEQDYKDWFACKKPKENVDAPVVVENEIGGRCVPECGPIGFKAA